MPHTDPEARAAYHKAYREKHKAIRSVARQAWGAENAEKEREYDRKRRSDPEKYQAILSSNRPRARAYYHLNKERVKARQQERVRANPEAAAVAHAATRARRRGAPGTGVTHREWQDILAEYNHRCAYCFGLERLEMDHIEPLISGGRHEGSNVAPACKGCNSSKNKHPLVIWLATYGKPLDTTARNT